MFTTMLLVTDGKIIHGRWAMHPNVNLTTPPARKPARRSMETADITIQDHSGSDLIGPFDDFEWWVR